MKRLLALVSMICMMLSVYVFAVETEAFTSGDYEYVLLEYGTVEITKYTGNNEKVYVPSWLDGYTVTSIGAHAFSFSNLRNIILPEGIKEIGDYAFSGCSNLSSITLPEGIKSIEDYAFAGCIRLTSITLPDGIQKIKDSAFKSCWNLSSITLPEGIQSIGNEAFSYCGDLSSINFPEGIQSIGDYVFKGTTGINSIILPDSIDTMGSNPFCNANVSISVSPDNPYLAVIDGVLFSKPDKRLIYCPKTKDNYAIPEGIERIGDSAFVGCIDLSSIVLPEGIKCIGDSAFGCCSSLSSITLPDSIEEMGSNPFWEDTSININVSPDNLFFTVIDGVLFSKTDKRLIYFPNTIEKYDIPDGIQSIGDAAFSDCFNLSSITLPKSLKNIGKRAFYYCENLSSITLPEELTSIGERAFYYCKSLSSIMLPEGLSSIGIQAFMNCENLVLTVPRDSYAAEYCKDNGLKYTFPDANDWLNTPSENADLVGSDQEYLETIFTSSCAKNIGTANVRLKRGFDFINTDSSIFNYELALTAVTLSAQVYKSAQGRNAEEILTELGYDDTDFMNVDSSFAQPGVCFGYKQLEDGKNIFVAVVRGTDTTDDLVDVWTDIQDGVLSMFRVSGDYVEIQLEDYMESVTGKTKAELQQEDNYFFFTGHSLGGAIANYLSVNKDVMGFANSDKGKIYTYTFEPPHTCVHLLGTDPESESNALNYKVDGDAVTNMPPYPGSTTYGKDEWIQVSELNNNLFNELFPDSKLITLTSATSTDGHGDFFGLHDTFLGLVYLVQQNRNVSYGDGGGGGSGR